MYLDYFGFQDRPFSITPDPTFLYMSAQHREALGHLLYGTGEHGGFVQLVGEVGTGKTTLIRALLDQEQPDLDIALCLNPHLTVNEFVASICDDLGVKYPRSHELTLKDLLDRLNSHLLEAHASGRRTVLIIDEAQNLNRELLEQVRLLTNLETRKHKLLRIILVGQPELESLLRREDMRQLAQRITARYYLRPLNNAETRHYVQHRLERVGGEPDVFSSAAYRLLYRLTGGVPRLVNTVCERALMGAYSRGRRQVGWLMIYRAARETLPRQLSLEPGILRQQLGPVAVLLAAVLLGFGLHYALVTPSDAADDSESPEAASAPVKSEASASSPTSERASAPEPAPPAQASEPASEEASQPDPASTQGVVESVPREVRLPDGNASMSQLLRLWGVFGAEVNTRCKDLAVGNLRCLDERGSFADLERFGRPALLTLEQDNRRRRVLLSGLNANTATLVFADGTRQWPRGLVAELWTGEFQLVWRLQTATRLLGPGSVGDAVVWLRRRLADAEGVNLDARAGRPSPVFDEELTTRLRQFQITHGLTPDGLVGSRTMILLNDLAPAPGTPYLQPRESA